MPTYTYQHPVTKKVYEQQRSFADQHKPYIAPDGVECPHISYFLTEEGQKSSKKHSKGLIDKKCEVWEKDPSYVKLLAPKYVRSRSGHRIKYDPTKHC